MTFTVVVTKDKQPRSFRWAIRAGVNQPSLSIALRSENSPSNARRAAERAFGKLEWVDAEIAGVDEHNAYVQHVAYVKTVETE